MIIVNGQCGGDPDASNNPLEVRLYNPHDVSASEDLRTVFVADTYSHCFRQVTNAGTPNATASVIAGVCGSSGYRDGEAMQAHFSTVHDIHNSDFEENLLYMGEQYNGAIRVLDKTSGAVSTVIGQSAVGFIDGNKDTAMLQYVHEVKELDEEVLLTVEYATNRLRRTTISNNIDDTEIATLVGGGSSTIYADQYRNGKADQYRNGGLLQYGGGWPAAFSIPFCNAVSVSAGIVPL